MARESKENLKECFNEASVDEIRELSIKIGIDTPFYSPRMPRENQAIDEPDPGYIGVYTKYITGGLLRFPLSELICDILKYYNIALAQVAPNSILKITTFEMLCRALKIVPCLALFRYFFRIRPNGSWVTLGLRERMPKIIEGLDSSIKEWKTRFFFIREQAAPLTSWRPKGTLSDPAPKIGTYNEEEVQKLLEQKVSVHEYIEPVLVYAGIRKQWRFDRKQLTLMEGERKMKLLSFMKNVDKKQLSVVAAEGGVPLVRFGEDPKTGQMIETLLNPCSAVTSGIRINDNTEPTMPNEVKNFSPRRGLESSSPDKRKKKKPRHHGLETSIPDANLEERTEERLEVLVKGNTDGVLPPTFIPEWDISVESTLGDQADREKFLDHILPPREKEAVLSLTDEKVYDQLDMGVASLLKIGPELKRRHKELSTRFAEETSKGEKLKKKNERLLLQLRDEEKEKLNVIAENEEFRKEIEALRVKGESQKKSLADLLKKAEIKDAEMADVKGKLAEHEQEVTRVRGVMHGMVREGLPFVVARLLGSEAFASELGKVQDVVLLLGRQQGWADMLERYEPSANVTSMPGYHPTAANEVEKQFEQLSAISWSYLHRIAQALPENFEDLKKISPDSPSK